MEDIKQFLERFVGRYLKFVGVKEFRLPYFRISFPLLGLGLVMVVFSLWFLSTNDFERKRLKLGHSSVLAEEFFRAAAVAANEGDVALAEELFLIGEEQFKNAQGVLGINNEVVGVVFPEYGLERRLEEIEEILDQQPTYRDALLEKVVLLYRLRRDEEAIEVFEKVKRLDPNNELVKAIEKIISLKSD